MVLLLLSVLAGRAEASPRQVERALELYQAGQLTRSLTAFERALASGDNAPADMPTIYRHLGELRAGAGDAAGAEEAFKKLFELDPAATAGPEWSPTVLEPFERARAAVVGGGGQQGGGQQGGGQQGGGQQGGGSPVQLTPEQGAFGPRLDSHVWTAPDEPRDSGVFGSVWFWGGVTAFVAAAVAVAILTASAAGEPYVSVDGGLSR